MTRNMKHIWSIVEPLANRNEFIHPLPWTTDGFTAIGGATIETSTERMRNGGPVLKVTGSGVTHTAITTLEVGKWYSFGVDIWAGENSEIRLSISGTSETFKVNGQWRRCDMDFLATALQPNLTRTSLSHPTQPHSIPCPCCRPMSSFTWLTRTLG